MSISSRLFFLFLICGVIAGCGGGGSSSGSSAPQITDLTPATLFQVGTSENIQILGSGFVPSSKAYCNGQPLVTTYVGATEVDAVLPPTIAELAENVTLQVLNPTAAGAASNKFSVTINQGAPVLSSLSPTSVVAGSSDFLLTVDGKGFLPDSVVLWNGNSVATTFVSPEELTAQVSASLVASIGTTDVAVQNPTSPGGSTGYKTTTAYLQVGYSVTSVTIQSNDIIWDTAHGVFYLSIPEDASNHPNTVAVMDPASGTILSSVSTGANPDLLAISDNDQYLYVATAGDSGHAPEIERYVLPGLTPDIHWSLGSNVDGNLQALDMRVAPGTPHTVAIATGTFMHSPDATGGVTVYDDATPRAISAADGVQLYDSLIWAPDAVHLYASSAGPYSDFYALTTSASGVSLTNSYPHVFLDNYGSSLKYYDPVSNIIFANDFFGMSTSGNLVTVNDGVANGAFWAAVEVDAGNNRQFLSEIAGGGLVLSSAGLNPFQPGPSLTLNYGPIFPTGTQTTPLRGRLLRFGTNGIAIKIFNANQVLLVTGQFVH